MDQDPHIVGVFFYAIISIMEFNQEQLKQFEGTTLDFNVIKDLFDDSWDLGYLSSDRLLNVLILHLKRSFMFMVLITQIVLSLIKYIIQLFL